MAPTKGEIVLLSDPSQGTVARASSVLQKNVKTYGPMNALNIKDESSCWYSDGEEGATQSLTINFKRQVTPTELKIQFQAGFSAETCSIHVRTGPDTAAAWELIQEIEEVEDTHDEQIFTLENNRKGDAIKIVFDEMTDFYGRVMIYKLGVWGKDKEENVAE